MRRRVVHLVIGALVVAGGLSGCTVARSNLGTTDSSCFLSLPTAGQAVGGHGRFVGIHLYSISQLRSLAPHLMDNLSKTHATTASHVCVAAYEGNFTASGVKKPLGRQSGLFAVVVVDASNQKLIATVIFRNAPLRFGHPHVA